VYKFMDPQLINPLENIKFETQTYVINFLVTKGEQIYMSPYIFMSKCNFLVINYSSLFIVEVIVIFNVGVIDIYLLYP